MGTRKILWDTIFKTYMNSQDTNVISSQNVLKLDALLLSGNIDNARGGVQLLISIASEYLCRYLDFKDDFIHLNQKFLSSGIELVLLEESMVVEVQKLPKWQKLYEAGAFDSMRFRCLGERSFECMSERDKDFCVKMSKEMVLVPAGDFMMGAFEDEEGALDNEYPCHKVRLTKSFFVGKYHVTQSLWESVTGENPSHFKGANRPVETVNWFDCVAFCNKLSEIENLIPVYEGLGDYQIGQEIDIDEGFKLSGMVYLKPGANGYRLLTEAEWEYSSMGGESYLFAGSDNIEEVAWYERNSERKTHCVGQKKPNAFGLYDMSGNVCHWCGDFIEFFETDDEYEITGNSLYTEAEQIDPTGPVEGSFRVFRGGCIFYDFDRIRVSFRDICDLNAPIHRICGAGFRLARTP
jgi:formylglycine-generating enzyme required for sulfatase activity